MEKIEKAILKEVRREQNISPFIKDITILQYIKDGIYDIKDDCCSGNVDFDKDFKARSLLKDYVFYANNKRLAEFKKLYEGEYVALQARYYSDTSI